MRIHVLSDLHTEFSTYEPHSVDCDVVVLAGDIDNHTFGIGWARRVWPSQEIIYVPGNHEYYGLERTSTLQAMRDTARKLGVHLLDNDAVVIDGMRFLGSTLWTDFKLFGESAKQEAISTGQRCLNDFRLIGERDKVLSPERSIELHEASLAWLSAKLKEDFIGETVVVTHHLPSMQSVSDRYKNSILSACFASNLDALFGRSALWIHGHTHDSKDYVQNGTRVLCNPRGYSRFKNDQENVDFNPTFVVEAGAGFNGERECHYKK